MPVVPNDVRDERHHNGDHRRPVETGFAVERLEESINEVLGIERHGLAILAALLARRDDPIHREELRREGIEPIDLVAVNLYPFAEHAASGKSGGMLLDQIDIGGATILRAAAKNYEHVVVVARPERYAAVLDELKQRSNVSLETRRVLASEAFSHTAAYDAAVASRFASEAGVQF